MAAKLPLHGKSTFPSFPSSCLPGSSREQDVTILEKSPQKANGEKRRHKQSRSVEDKENATRRASLEENLLSRFMEWKKRAKWQEMTEKPLQGQEKDKILCKSDEKDSKDVTFWNTQVTNVLLMG